MKKHLILSTALALLLSIAATAQDLSVEQALDLPPTSIQFDETEYNFGEVQQDDIVQHIYRFTNVGDEPLLLTNARASCGCTVPSWPKEPIPPGGTGAIVVEFDTKGKYGAQTKQITITANIVPAQSILYLSGEIVKKSEENDPALSPIPAPNMSSLAAGGITVSAYPNPATDLLNLKVEGENKAAYAQIEVYNSTGQLVHAARFAEASSSLLSIDVSRLAVGNYWASVKIGDHDRVNIPFVVSR